MRHRDIWYSGLRGRRRAPHPAKRSGLDLCRILDANVRENPSTYFGDRGKRPRPLLRPGAPPRAELRPTLRYASITKVNTLFPPPYPRTQTSSFPFPDSLIFRPHSARLERSPGLAEGSIVLAA